MCAVFLRKCGPRPALSARQGIGALADRHAVAAVSA